MEKNIDPIAQDLSNQPLFGTSCPACRSHRSEMNERSRKTTVMTLPVMNSGLRPCAPTSEMYLEIRQTCTIFSDTKTLTQ
jgi:hypothetical protein